MTTLSRTSWLGCFLPLLLAATAAGAQTSASGDKGLTATSKAADSVATGDSAAPKKKGGLFGKVKGLAGNKTVQQVAKTAACTMVPGGQAIAGAIDAASTKDAGKAAAGAAGAASGSTCMPAGLGGPAMAGTGMGGSGVVGAAEQAAAAKAAGGRAGVPLGYGLMPGMPTGATGAGSMEEMPGQEEMAKCLGMSPDEYLDLVDPTRGEPRQMTKAEMKRQAKLAKKMDLRRYQACMLQPGSVEE